MESRGALLVAWASGPLCAFVAAMCRASRHESLMWTESTRPFQSEAAASVALSAVFPPIGWLLLSGEVCRPLWSAAVGMMPHPTKHSRMPLDHT